MIAAKIRMIILLSGFLTVTNGLFAEERLFISLSYAPGLSDYIRLDSSPENHTIKRSVLGFDHSLGYFPKTRWGFGYDTHWGMIDQFRIKNGSNELILDQWTGRFYQLHFSPQVYFIPYEKENHILCLGLGPSFTMAYYLSKYNNDFEDFYIGLDFNARYRYMLKESFFLNVGLRTTIDYVYFGGFVENIFTDFIQLQCMPELGIGFKF
ncbi:MULTISPECIES: hypothetical protein [unclassified Oceanispirochaeta]|uniref:hypothetical protein n=1 Tax=unclassified Oceanispirochaeta TaxID=2635722 RepID=UPI000E08D963|nr:MULTISPECIES: hypothetical protein [unclassified Oceanispirochaeta]MBF9019007.1 hypothetical protein [Oceanispirochaeta sp. M2]NPD75507.1 hypothetical protein [Oceanispirochaeta sp. M1]RDG28641.1 hypothetical protein DV872_25780 [Oceanispirochaeta sp. M1]